MALPSGQQHAQAGDAAFEFLELADVHHDRGEAQVVQELASLGPDLSTLAEELRQRLSDATNDPRT